MRLLTLPASSSERLYGVRPSVCPSVRPSVCFVARNQQRRAAGLLLSSDASVKYRPIGV